MLNLVIKTDDQTVVNMAKAAQHLQKVPGSESQVVALKKQMLNLLAEQTFHVSFFDPDKKRTAK